MTEKKNLKEWSCLQKRLFRQCCFVGPREWSPIDFPLLPRELPKQLLLCLEVQDRQHVWQNHGGDCRFWCKEWQFWMLIRSTCIRQDEYLSKWSSSYMSTIFLNRTLNDLSIFFVWDSCRHFCSWSKILISSTSLLAWSTAMMTAFPISPNSQVQ